MKISSKQILFAVAVVAIAIGVTAQRKTKKED